MKNIASALAVVAALSAFGSSAANATVIGAPSVTGLATTTDLTRVFDGALLSDRLQVIPSNGIGQVVGIGVTEAQESNCGSNGTFIGNIFGAGVTVANACEFGLADHSVNPNINVNIGVNLPLEGRPTLVYEPDGTLSDIFGIDCEEEFNGGNGGCYLFFLSKINDQPFILPPALDTSNWFSVTELAGGAGTIFDMTIYLDPTQQAATGWTARFISANDVPEPLTMSLFSVGLAGMAAIRRRRDSAKA